MNVTRQNLLDIDYSIQVLLQEKLELIDKKKRIETDISAINNAIKGAKKANETEMAEHFIQSKNDILQTIPSIQEEISNIKNKLRERHNLRDEIKNELQKQNGGIVLEMVKCECGHNAPVEYIVYDNLGGSTCMRCALKDAEDALKIEKRKNLKYQKTK